MKNRTRTIEGDIEILAATCHEANRAYSFAIGEEPRPHWEDAPAEHRQAIIEAVRFRLEHPAFSDRDQHDIWMAKKLLGGWKYGPVRDAKKKEMPCLLPFHALTRDQRFKDAIFGAIVDAWRRTVRKDQTDSEAPEA